MSEGEDFWEEEHGHEHDGNEADDDGSDWKTEDEMNPFEAFIFSFLENLNEKVIKDPESFVTIKRLVDSVLERDWFSEDAETEATTAVFAMIYATSLGASLNAKGAKGLYEVVKKCIRNDIKAEGERN